MKIYLTKVNMYILLKDITEEESAYLEKHGWEKHRTYIEFYPDHICELYEELLRLTTWAGTITLM